MPARKRSRAMPAEQVMQAPMDPDLRSALVSVKSARMDITSPEDLERAIHCLADAIESLVAGAVKGVR